MTALIRVARLSSMRLFTFFLLLMSPWGAYPLSMEREAQDLLESEKNTIQVYRNNAASVVYVSNIRLARRGFFGPLKMENPTGAGSGFVWDKKGHIVTNYHVVAGGGAFVIKFHGDKKEYPAEVRGTAPRKDLAVLKLQELPPKLVPISVGHSDGLIVGQKATALGNPFGLDHTITAGIVSGLGRKMQGIGGVTIENMIQTDASINPGNSGGPLLDSSGRVIGVNTMILSKSGSSAGVGFAVPVDTVKRIVPQIIEHGEVARAGLGIILEERFSIKRYFGVKEGVIVRFVDPKSPAHGAGMMGITTDDRGRYFLGDVILAIDGQKTADYDDVYHVLDKKKVGDVATVTVRRGEEKGTRAITTRLIKL